MAREMKNSGIPWIGDIPTTWKLVRICNVTDVIFLGRTPVYSEHENWNYIIGQKNNQSYGIDFEGIKYGEDTFYSSRPQSEFLKYGDVILNTLGGGSVGRIGFWNINNTANYLTDGHIMVIRPNKEIYDKFLYYALLSQQKVFEDDAVGSTNQAFLTISQVYKKVIAYVDYENQKKIADFIGSECKKINAVIERIRASIGEYKKLKQTVITDAVTKGIWPDQQMKDSGIEWIGMIPVDWSVSPIKRILAEKNEKTPTGEGEQLSVNQKKGVVRAEESDASNPSLSTVDWKIVHKNDIVFNKYKAHSGVFFVSNYDGIVTFNYSVFHCINGNCPKYYEYQFKTDGCIGEFKKQMRGVGESISPLYTRDLFKIFVAVPPSAIQQAIANYIDNKLNDIDGLIREKENLIAELETLKKSLIYEYVTGKKEVPA